MTPQEAADYYVNMYASDEANKFETHHAMAFALEYEATATESDYNAYLEILDCLVWEMIE